MGGARARALLLDPAKLTAADAAGLGLVTETTTDLAARVGALAGKLAAQAPKAMRYAKENLADAGSATLPDYLRREVPRMVECAAAVTRGGPPKPSWTSANRCSPESRSGMIPPLAGVRVVEFGH